MFFSCKNGCCKDIRCPCWAADLKVITRTFCLPSPSNSYPLIPFLLLSRKTRLCSSNFLIYSGLFPYDRECSSHMQSNTWWFAWHWACARLRALRRYRITEVLTLVAIFLYSHTIYPIVYCSKAKHFIYFFLDFQRQLRRTSVTESPIGVI